MAKDSTKTSVGPDRPNPRPHYMGPPDELRKATFGERFEGKSGGGEPTAKPSDVKHSYSKARTKRMSDDRRIGTKGRNDWGTSTSVEKK